MGMFPEKSIHKRSISFLGDLTKTIAGNPSESDARRWDKSFKEIKNGLKQQTNLNENTIKERKLVHEVLGNHNEQLRNLTRATKLVYTVAKQSQTDNLAAFNLITFINSLETLRENLEGLMFETEIAYVQGRSSFLPHTYCPDII